MIKVPQKSSLEGNTLKEYAARETGNFTGGTNDKYNAKEILRRRAGRRRGREYQQSLWREFAGKPE